MQWGQKHEAAAQLQAILYQEAEPAALRQAFLGRECEARALLQELLDHNRELLIVAQRNFFGDGAKDPEAFCRVAVLVLPLLGRLDAAALACTCQALRGVDYTVAHSFPDARLPLRDWIGALELMAAFTTSRLSWLG